MRCLRCGKELDNSSNGGWHKRCIKDFFGTETLPVIDLQKENIEQLVSEKISKKNTVAGVQKKISLHLSEIDVPRLTLMDFPTGYILKPQTEEYPSLPEYEHLSMQMAEAAGIKTVPHALIEIDGAYNYITRRIDRNISNGEIDRFAMEDFCQLSKKLTADKYKGSYEQCGKIIKEYSRMEGIDISELFIRVVFSFIIGNSDMHLKNYSLIESEPGSRSFNLSAAYDMLPVNIVLPEDAEETALSLNGKKKNLRKKDFITFAENIGISKNAAEKMIRSVCSKQAKFFELCDVSCLEDDRKEGFKALITERVERLG